MLLVEPWRGARNREPDRAPHPFPVICLRVTKHGSDSSDNLPNHRILKPNGAWLSGRRVTGVPHVSDSAAGCNQNSKWDVGPVETFRKQGLCTATYMTTKFKVMLGTPAVPAARTLSHLCFQPPLLDGAVGLRVPEPLAKGLLHTVPGASLGAELLTQPGRAQAC